MYSYRIYIYIQIIDAFFEIIDDYDHIDNYPSPASPEDVGMNGYS